jgi:hypothetical protein
LKYKSTIEKIIDEQEELMESNFDELLNDFEKNLDENDILLG